MILCILVGDQSLTVSLLVPLFLENARNGQEGRMLHLLKLLFFESRKRPHARVVEPKSPPPTPLLDRVRLRVPTVERIVLENMDYGVFSKRMFQRGLLEVLVQPKCPQSPPSWFMVDAERETGYCCGSDGQTSTR